MANTFNTDRNDAIDALARGLESIEQRLSKIGEKIAQAKYDRQKYVNEEVGRLLPNISSSTLRRLEIEIPSFLDKPVMDAFTDNAKILGLFPRPGYRQALVAMQTKLAQYIDTARRGIIPSIDGNLAVLIAERDSLERMQHDSNESLRMLEKTKQNKLDLQGDTKTVVSQIAQKARDISSGRATFMHQRSQRFQSEVQQFDRSGNDDTDMWIYLMTDIPTSFRTLMFNAISNHDRSESLVHGGGGTFDGGGASGDYKSSSDCDSVNQSSNGTEITSQALRSEIATDDSLGSFS